MGPGSAHARIERAFGRWGELVVRRPWRVIGVALLATAGLLAGLPRLTADFSHDLYLLGDDPIRRVYDAFRNRFGTDERLIVGIETPEVFDLAFLERLRAFHADVERRVPHVEEVSSLVNARSTRGVDNALVVGELMEDFSNDGAWLAAFREAVLANPLYLNTYLSRDRSFTALLVEPATYSSRGEAAALEGFDEPAAATPEYLGNEELGEAIDALYEVAEGHDAPGFRLHLAGAEIMAKRLQSISVRDTALYGALAALSIAGLLLLLFRRITATFLPLLVVSLSVLATFGATAHLGIPFNMVSQALPTFLMAVGICDAVHILAIVYRRLAAGDAQGRAIARALEHSGLAVLLTSLTTAGGLASFLAAEIQPVALFGVAAPLGVLLALAYSLTLLPALLAVVPLHPPRAGSRGVAGPVDAALARLGDVATGHPKTVLLATALVLALGLLGLRDLRFGNFWLDYLFEDDPVRVAIERIDRSFEGTTPVEVLIDSGREDGLHDPALLARIDAAAGFARSLREGEVRVGSAVSIADIVKEINQALHENRPEHYALPESRRLVAQELLLFENSGSDDLEDVTDTLFREARLRIGATTTDGMFYLPFLDALERRFGEILGDGVAVTITGGMPINSRVFSLLLGSLVRSYVLALVVITPLMILMIGSFRLGLLAMIPNLIPVYLTLALMGWLGIDLDFSTLIIGSIVIGVAVDDTIHFMHKWSRYYETGGDARGAVRKTLATTGTALLVTSLVLAASFYVFLFGHFYGMIYVGILAGTATLFAFLADVLVAPALLMLATRSRP